MVSESGKTNESRELVAITQAQLDGLQPAQRAEFERQFLPLLVQARQAETILTIRERAEEPVRRRGGVLVALGGVAVSAGVWCVTFPAGMLIAPILLLLGTFLAICGTFLVVGREVAAPALDAVTSIPLLSGSRVPPHSLPSAREGEDSGANANSSQGASR